MESKPKGASRTCPTRLPEDDAVIHTIQPPTNYLRGLACPFLGCTYIHMYHVYRCDLLERVLCIVVVVVVVDTTGTLRDDVQALSGGGLP